MYDDMFPTERDASLSQSVQRPYTPPTGPGAFTGFGSALSDIVPSAVLTTTNAWSGILDAYGKAAAYRDAPAAAMLAGRPAPNMDELQKQTIDQIGDNQLGPQLRNGAKKYAPDPLTVGTAGQIVFGVGTSLAKAGMYSLTGLAAPVLFGTDVGINRADELKDQGVDATAANLSGVASGAVGALGMKVPAAFGATRLQSAAIGAVINPALNVAEVGGIRMLLQHANYDKIAAQYQPFDPVNLTVAALTGAAFGAAFHGGKAQPGEKAPEAPPLAPEATLTPDEHAAALTMNDVYTREGDTLTAPGDIAAANAATDAQALARQQLDAGEQVSVAADVPADPQRMEAAARAIYERATEDIRAELLADAGNRAQPGEIPTARAQLAALQNDIELIQAEGVFKAEAKAHQQQGLSRKQAEAAARDAIGQRQADLQAQADRLNNFIEANSRAAQAEQDLAMLNQGQVPERFAHLVNGETPSGGVDALARSSADQSRSADTPVPESAPKADVLPEQSPIVERVMDAVSRLLGRDDPAQPKAESLKADTPEQGRAFDLAARNPDALIPTGELDADGSPVLARFSDLMQQVADVEKQAKTETAAFAAAVNCALRFPR